MTTKNDVGLTADRLNEAIRAVEEAFEDAGLVFPAEIVLMDSVELRLGWQKTGRLYALVLIKAHDDIVIPLTSASLALRVKAASGITELYEALVRKSEGGQHVIARAADTFFDLAKKIERQHQEKALR